MIWASAETPLASEQDVVGAAGVEGRAKIDEVDRFVGDVLAQDREVVTVEEGVIGHVERLSHCGARHRLTPC
jgi:hypothetical protein